MFERFTDRARRVVVLSQEEARKLNHNYIGTEHLLLGLVHEGEGVAAKALESLGVDLTSVRDRVKEIIGQGGSPASGHIPFTPRAKKVMELSLREALQLGHNYIGTEHILLALIREGEGVGAQVLQDSGAELNRVRQQVLQLLSGYAGHKSPTKEDSLLFPAFSGTGCPKCPSATVKSAYQPPKVTLSKALKKVLSLGEHLRRECEECGYVWAEACRTNRMAPNSPYTAEEDLEARVAALQTFDEENTAAAS
jgi:ATP-dependent Clp protease ATP-binding subunit ClpA